MYQTTDLYQTNSLFVENINMKMLENSGNLESFKDPNLHSVVTLTFIFII
jgi:hypothetical protein